MQNTSQAAVLNLDQRRDQAERLVQFAQHLSPGDRDLLCSVYQRGMSATELARVIGTRPRSVRSRVRRLVRRLNSPTFRYVLQARDKWPPRKRKIAEAVFLRGEGQRKAAVRLQTTVHEVRRETDRIRAIAEAAFQK